MGVRKYMSSISCRTSAKNEIDELKPDDMSYADFVEELIAAYKRDDGEIVSPEKLVEEIKQQIATNVEIAAYRGANEAIENYVR